VSRLEIAGGKQLSVRDSNTEADFEATPFDTLAAVIAKLFSTRQVFAGRPWILVGSTQRIFRLKTRRS